MPGALARHTRPLRRRLWGGFRRSLEDPNASLSLDMGRPSRTLLIAFGGMQGRLGMPPFEFFRVTGALPVKRLFVRDLHQAWYHRGIPGGGSSIAETAVSLRRLIARHELERIVVTGNSSGGYAALVFGTLLGADAALCFAPQTVLDLDVLAGMGDRRWDERLRPLAQAGALDARWSDLRRALPTARGADAPDTRYEVYFDDLFDLDRLHAERLAELDGIALHPRRGGAHEIVRRMRATGELERVLRGMLHVPQTTAP